MELRHVQLLLELMSNPQLMIQASAAKLFAETEDELEEMKKKLSSEPPQAT